MQSSWHPITMRTAIVLLTAFALSGCIDLAGEPSRGEVASVISPDGKIRAVLFETNGGATTSFGYEIELQPQGSPLGEAVSAGKLYGATRSECSWGANLRWSSPTELIVEFKEADQAKLQTTVQIGNSVVAVVQHAGVSDETAPCGGMIANIR